MPHGYGSGAGGGRGGEGTHYHSGRREYLIWGLWKRRGCKCNFGNLYCWISFFVILFAVCLIVAIILGVTFSTKSDNTDDNVKEDYALTDKILLTYSTAFCQRITATYTNELSISESNATLYMLSSPPPLSDVELFNISGTVTLRDKVVYYQLNFYLNEGSRVLLTACELYDDLDSVLFYVFKGSNNFNRWIANDFIDDYYEESHFVFSGLPCRTISYDVTESDRYYFAFYDYLHYNEADVKVLFQFQRSVYHISLDSVVTNCSFPLDGQSKCSVGVPLSSGNAAVLSLNTSLPVDYDQGASISISCQPRAWLYAVITMSAVVTGVIVTILVTVCVYKIIKKRMNEYSLVAGGIISRTVIAPSTAAVNKDPNESSPLIHPT